VMIEPLILVNLSLSSKTAFGAVVTSIKNNDASYHFAAPPLAEKWQNAPFIQQIRS
jgi:hypothetical protein